MLIDIRFDSLGNKSNILSTITTKLKENLKDSKLSEYIEEFPLSIIEKTIFEVFSKIAQAQGLDETFVKRVVYDTDQMGNKVNEIFDVFLTKKFYAMAIYPTQEQLKNLIGHITEEISSLSAQMNGIVLDKDNKPLPIKEKSDLQKMIDKNNSTANIHAEAMQLQVEFKTGNLLISDQLSIKELKEITDSVLYGSQYSLNDYAGTFERTKNLAEKFNIFSISVGDVGPAIFQNNDTLVFGHTKKNYQSDQFHDLGTVCTNFWGVTIYEKENIIELLSHKVGEEKAIQLVEEQVGKYGVFEAKVSPGIYQLTCAKDFEKFSSSAKNNSLKFPSSPNIKPWFTLEKIDLNLDNTIKNKKKKMK